MVAQIAIRKMPLGGIFCGRIYQTRIGEMYEKTGAYDCVYVVNVGICGAGNSGLCI